jgi:hypothetical protein
LLVATCHVCCEYLGYVVHYLSLKSANLWNGVPTCQVDPSFAMVGFLLIMKVWVLVLMIFLFSKHVHTCQVVFVLVIYFNYFPLTLSTWVMMCNIYCLGLLTCEVGSYLWSRSIPCIKWVPTCRRCFSTWASRTFSLCNKN